MPLKKKVQRGWRILLSLATIVLSANHKTPFKSLTNVSSRPIRWLFSKTMTDKESTIQITPSKSLTHGESTNQITSVESLACIRKTAGGDGHQWGGFGVLKTLPGMMASRERLENAAETILLLDRVSRSLDAIYVDSEKCAVGRIVPLFVVSASPAFPSTR